MRVVYIAGPLTDASEYEVVKNRLHAWQLAVSLWQLGFCVICPHLNTAGMIGMLPEEKFYEGDLEILRRCDAVCTIHGWQRSIGASREVTEANEKGIPVFDDPLRLADWAEAQDKADGTTVSVNHL